MRTTLDIEPDVLDEARKTAEARGISMGRVISDWARKGSQTPVTFTMRNGIAVFDVPPGTRKFGLEDVEKALDEDDLEYAKYFNHQGDA